MFSSLIAGRRREITGSEFTHINFGPIHHKPSTHLLRICVMVLHNAVSGEGMPAIVTNKRGDRNGRPVL
jgi:hypothetical protein